VEIPTAHHHEGDIQAHRALRRGDYTEAQRLFAEWRPGPVISARDAAIVTRLRAWAALGAQGDAGRRAVLLRELRELAVSD
jgi:hypothetical protein